MDDVDSAAYQQRLDMGRRMSAALDEIDEAILEADTEEEFKEVMEASLASLEQRLDHLGAFTQLSPSTRSERAELTHIDRRALIRVAREYALKDPMCHQAVQLTTHYTFGEGGLRYASTLPDVSSEVEDFWTDEDNQIEITSPEAQERKSAELQVDGEIFFILFRDEENRLKVRTLPPEEIIEIITSEDDHRRPLYYKRVWRPVAYNMKTGLYEDSTKDRVAYYADWKNYAVGEWGMEHGTTPAEGVIYHVKVNSIGWQQRGFSELYSFLDWAKANRQLLVDWVTIVKAYSTLAWKAKISGDDPAQINKIRDRIRSYLPDAQQRPGNATSPAGVAGVAISNDQVDLSPMKTAGMATDPSDSRQVRLMISAGSGIMEHYFGDAGNANLATATAMELPMLKKFGARQRFWEGVYTALALYAIIGGVEAGRVTSVELEERSDARGRTVTRRLTTPEVDGNKKTIVHIKAPPILKTDLQATALALQGFLTAGLVPAEQLSRAAMEALDLPNIDALIASHDVEKMRKDMIDSGTATPPPPPPGTPGDSGSSGASGGPPRGRGASRPRPDAPRKSGGKG